MEFFRIKRDLPFMRYALIANVISLVTFLAAVGFLVTKGLHLSIEFTGGTVMEVSYADSADLEKTRGAVAGLGFTDALVQNFGTSHDVMIRLPLREGVGLANTRARLLSEYRGRASLQLRTAPGAGFAVTLHLPADRP